MRRLIARARKNGLEGEVPVAALILNSKGLCIGHGRNRRNKRRYKQYN